MRVPLLPLWLCVPALAGCVEEQAPEPPEEVATLAEEAASDPIAPENLRRAELRVEGMTCSGFEYNVCSGLELVDGVAGASADAKKGRAYVEYDVTRVSVEDLVAAVVQVGYRTESLSSGEGSED